jgi:hypothetical protein
MYDAKRFTDAGFRHYELYFPDGSCPPDTITARFLEIAEREGGNVLSGLKLLWLAKVAKVKMVSVCCVQHWDNIPYVDQLLLQSFLQGSSYARKQNQHIKTHASTRSQTLITPQPCLIVPEEVV